MKKDKTSKISLLGNCQTKALTWYIQQLDASFDARWICIEKFLKNWGPHSRFAGKSINVITDNQEAIKHLKSSDYVICQPVLERTSWNYNINQLKKYVSRNKLILINSFWYLPKLKHPENGLQGMIDRAEEFNIDIPAHKIIEKHGSKIKVQQKNHPRVFYFLELVREICSRTGWNYYSDKQYNKYLKEGYPFG